MVPPWPWKTVMIDWRDVVDLVRVQRPEQRPETADQRVEIERRLGVRQRDECRRRQDPVGALAVAALELQVAVTDQVRGSGSDAVVD